MSPLPESRKDERPILFSGPMVRAILEGRKTQTRRVVKPQPVSEGLKSFGESWAWNVGRDPWFSGVTEQQMRSPTYGLKVYCPYGAPGDRLWVRETLEVVANWGSLQFAADGEYCYNPDHQKVGFPYVDEAHAIVEKYGDSYFANDVKRVPSIFMPRWASRITLEVTEVRVQRVQEITEEDAKAEGVRGYEEDGCWVYEDYQLGSGTWSFTAKGSFRSLWDSINGKPKYLKGAGFGGETAKFESTATWDVNPWVWCVTFKKEE